jgi:HK97 family phage major capsid protein
MPNLNELMQTKKELADAARAIMERCDTEGRSNDWTGDETKKFDDLHDQIEKVNATIARAVRQQAIDDTKEPRRADPTQPDRVDRPRTFGAEPRAADFGLAVRSWLLAGRGVRSDAGDAAAKRVGIDPMANQVGLYLPPVAMRASGWDPSGAVHPTKQDIRDWRERNEEFRAAMGTTSGAVGGYSVPNETMQALEVALLQFGGMRGVSTVIRTDTGASLPFPTTNDSSNKGAILSENTQVSEVDPTFGQLTLDAYMYSSKLVLVSLQLLQDSSVDIGAMLGRLLGERIGRIQNDHFTTGTGSSQPNGVVTAATSSGITLAGATSISYDNLMDLIHSVDPAYRPNGRFMFHDTMLKTIKKVKIAQYSGDTAGIPLWQPSLVVGQPDTIHGYPFVVNQSVGAVATGVKSILFGDFSKYLIRDTREITMVRLNERYIDYHQVGFLAFARSDGDLLDAGTHPIEYATQA